MIKNVLNVIFFLLIVSTFTLNAIPGISSVSMMLTGLFLLLNFLVERKIVVYKELILPVAFMAFEVLSLLWDGSPEEVGKVASAILFGIAIFVGLKSGPRLPILVWALIVCAVGNVVLSYGNISTFEATDEESRVAGLFGNANEVAVFLSIAAFIIYFLSARRTLFIKLLTFVLLAFVFFYTGSRQGLFLVVFICGSIFVDYFWGLRGPKRIWRWPAVFAVLFLLTALFHSVRQFSDDVIVLKRLETFLDGSEKGSARTRAFMIEKGIQLWQEKPIIGWGAAGFVKNGYFTAYAHNTYIEILADFGLIGFLLYYGAYVHVLIMGWLYRSRYAARIGTQLLCMLIVLGTWAVLFRSKSGWLFLAIALFCISARGKEFDRVDGRVE